MPVAQRPLFGVITTSVAPRRNAPANYEPKPIWHHLEQHAHTLGLRTIFFRPEDLDPTTARVHGWICLRRRDKAGTALTWRRVTARLPDVVFDNVFVHLAHTKRMKQLRRFFHRRRIPLFNPSLGHKAELADWLRRYPELWKHHPDTRLLSKKSDVETYLERHHAVYLKPVSGSMGIGILEIRPAENDRGYLVRAEKYGPAKTPLEQNMTPSQLYLFLQKELRRTAFILQQGCDLLHLDGGKIDLRTHLQRDGEGEWECVALIVKRGRPNSIVSNYHAGGSRHDWAWLTEQAQRLRLKLPASEQVIELSRQVAAAYAEKASTLSSIGLDIGLDTDGNMWLLDVNSRPGRNILDAEQKRRCQELNAEFARYLIRTFSKR